MTPGNFHLLGQIALNEGYLTPEKLDECLKLQEAADPPRRLGAILLEKGYLTAEQLKSVLDIQRLKLDAISADPERGGLFGQIALRLGFVTQLQLDECLREQQALSQGGSPVLLGQLLLRKNYLTTDQFLEILRKQKKEVVKCTGCDTFYDTAEKPPGAKFACSRCGTIVAIPVRPSRPEAPGQETRGLLKQVQGEIQAEAIGRYVLLEQIGLGGMAVVYKALHKDLNRVFALKVLRAGELTTVDTVKRFQREARLAAKLKHPHIVAVHDAGEEDGLHYIAMEYIDGETLAARLMARRGRIREHIVIMEKVARAVAYAHEREIVHRDLKPANVMIDREGEPHIMDFGLAKQTFDGSLLTRSGAFLGTPFYMAPEQIVGDSSKIDGKSDVYSLGVMLYEILSGRVPHGGMNTVEIFHRIVNDDPPRPRELNARVHPDLQTVCLRAMEKDRALRYPNAEALAEDLRRYLDGEPILARPVGWAVRIGRRFRKNPALSVAAFTSALLLVAGAFLLALAYRSGRAFRAAMAEADYQRRLGNHQLARAALDQALEIRPNDPEARDLRARASYRIEEEQRLARERQEAAIKRDRADPHVAEAARLLRRLEVRLAAERPPADEVRATCAEAERRLGEALAVFADHDEAYLWLGRARVLAGDLDGAARHLTEALGKNSGSLEAYFERGRVYLRKYRRPRGLPALLPREDRPLFTDASPDSPATEEFRRQARQDFAVVRTHAAEPGVFTFAEAALEFLDLRFAEAEKKVDGFLQRFPGDPDALALRALSRLYQARPDRAAADLTAALRYRPHDGFLADWRAVCRWLVRDVEGALSDLEREAPEPGTLCIRGTLLYVEGRPREALEDFHRAAEAAPRWADAFAGRAAARWALGQAAEAEEDYGRAIALEPLEAALYENRGLLRFKAGRRAEAAADLERAIELSPSREPRLRATLVACKG